MKRELFMSGTAPCLSTLCLPDVTACDQFPRPSPSVFAYYTNKYWRWEWRLKYNHTGSEIWSTTNKTCQYTLLSKPFCAKEERNGPPSDNQGLSVPNPRYGCAIFTLHVIQHIDIVSWSKLTVRPVAPLKSVTLSMAAVWPRMACFWSWSRAPSPATCHSWLGSASEGKYQQATYIITFWCGRSQCIYACVNGKCSKHCIIRLQVAENGNDAALVLLVRLNSARWKDRRSNL